MNIDAVNSSKQIDIELTLNMRKVLMAIPIMTLLANVALLLGIPILREIVVFIFLTFIPGFAILRLFKLKEISLLDSVLFSVGLSIALVMFIGLLVNELFILLGLSQPLSTIPLMAAISAFTLTVFFIEYRRDLSEKFKPKTSFDVKLKTLLPLSIILFLLPFLSAIGVVYLNTYVILLSDAIIAALCVMIVVFRRRVPENLFPLLIFSISIVIVFQVLLTSKYIIGWDANLEYYVFRVTQINGHWGFLNPNVNSLGTLNLDSMLSVTLLPAVYSTLMSAQGEIVFKVLYPFIFCLVPITLYRICEKQFGKMIALFSVFFFIFTSVAFFDTEILSLNRQIVGEFFLVLSLFLLISKTVPATQRRLLLIIFGAALAVSHYALAYFYLGIVAVVFIISRVKPKFDDTLNSITVLLLFGITFSWYALTSAPLIELSNAFKLAFAQLTAAPMPTGAVASSSGMFGFPQVFTAASWINLLLTGIANLFLIIGVLLIFLRPKGTGISAQYRVMSIVAALILAVTFIEPSIGSILNFTRFYAIILLFLAPCFVLGGHAFLVTIGKVWKKIKRPLKHQIASKSKNIDIAFLLMAIILGGYFLSQTGFVTRVASDTISNHPIDFERMIVSNETQVKIGFYDNYISEQDVYSASWLLNHNAETAEIFADYLSASHVLLSYGLIPNELLLPITNTTIPPQGSFIYLSSLNIGNDAITTLTGSFNTSEISSLLNQNNLVYSNGNGEIWYVTSAP